ncbi:MAG: hypothetical protein IJV54_00040, partial [Bacteroidales bacterium]|nr:hypothetical protein [Bacteroidales bacterium]
MYDQAIERYEIEPLKIKKGIETKGGVKNAEAVNRRLGRVRSKYASVAKCLTVTIGYDDGKGAKRSAVTMTIERNAEVEEEEVKSHGKYFLGTDLDISDLSAVWAYYNVVSVVEEAFSVLKGDLDFRPIFHKTDNGIKAHINLTLLAYWIVSYVRHELKKGGINYSWTELLRIMNTQHRVTITGEPVDGRMHAIRKSSVPEKELEVIQDILDIPRASRCYIKSVGPKTEKSPRSVKLPCRDGVHACNLSAVVADELAYMVNEVRNEQKIDSPFGMCQAYIADPPMADEMLPECRIGGLPEFPRRAFFHALNSRATVKQYLRKHGHEENDVTVIVAHLGNGITVTLHKNGEVIDTNNGLGGDGPFTQERAGTCPAFPLIEMCFSGKYSESDIKKKILGGGGAVAYFGTNDMEELSRRAAEGEEDCQVFLKAFCL